MKKILCLALVLIIAIPVAGLAAAKMQMNKTSKTLYLNEDNKTNTGNSFNFSVKNKGTNYKAKYTFTWYAADDSIIDVAKSGVVTAKKVGTTTVKCDVKLKKTGKLKTTLKATVTVNANAETVEITNAPENNEIEVGSTFNFKRTMKAANGGQATDKTEWSVSKEKIGTINKNGVFTAKKAGEVEIYCKTYQSAATKSKGYTAESKPVTITVYEKRPSGLSAVAPSVLDGSDGKIEGTTAKMEYDVETEFTNPKDCSEDETTGLTAGTYYVRYKKTKKRKASDYTAVVIPDGKPIELTGTVEITGEEKFAGTLTATVKETNNTGTLSYQWKRVGENETDIGANSDKYTVVKDDINSVIKCVVTSDEQSGSILAATGTIEKADGPEAPEGLTGVSPSVYGGSNGKITGTTALMEYSKTEDFADALDCEDENTTGLKAGTYYARYKETATHKAGESASVTVPAGAKVNARVSPKEVYFYEDSVNVDIKLYPGSYSFRAIELDGKLLKRDDNYSVENGVYTISYGTLSYLLGSVENPHTITFDMSGGTDPTVSLYAYNGLKPTPSPQAWSVRNDSPSAASEASPQATPNPALYQK